MIVSSLIAVVVQESTGSNLRLHQVQPDSTDGAVPTFSRTPVSPIEASIAVKGAERAGAQLGKVPPAPWAEGAGSMMNRSSDQPSSTYTVTFTESGLPTGSYWAVYFFVVENPALNGTVPSQTTTVVIPEVPNGTYGFSVLEGVVGLEAEPDQGTVQVDGGPVAVPIAFAPQPAGYTLINVRLVAFGTYTQLDFVLEGGGLSLLASPPYEWEGGVFAWEGEVSSNGTPILCGDEQISGPEWSADCPTTPAYVSWDVNVTGCIGTDCDVTGQIAASIGTYVNPSSPIYQGFGFWGNSSDWVTMNQSSTDPNVSINVTGSLFEGPNTTGSLCPCYLNISGYTYPSITPYSLDLTDTTSVNLSLSPGRYYFVFQAANGFPPILTNQGTFVQISQSLSTGSFVVGPVESEPFNVDFEETGLPSGTPWTVDFGGEINESTSNSIGFDVVNGTYAYLVSSADNSMIPYSNYLTVNGASQAVEIDFYNVTFNQTDDSQLPVDRAWNISLDGILGSAPTGLEGITFLAANGTYAYEIGYASGYGAFTNGTDVEASGVNFGNATVLDDDTFVNVTFLQFTFGVLFTEKGLPQKLLGTQSLTVTDWSVTLTNVSSQTSRTVRWDETESLFAEPNGTYSFLVAPIADWSILPQSGTVQVNGASLVITISFALLYNLTFNETGLPAHATWALTLDGIDYSNETTGGSNPTGSIVVQVENGTQTFAIDPVAGTVVVPSSGTFQLRGPPPPEGALFLNPLPAFQELASLYATRADLRAAYPGVGAGNLTDFESYVYWAASVVYGLFSDSANNTLGAPDIAYDYILLGLYDVRSDLQTVYPAAYTNWTSYVGLLAWAGEVVMGQFVDSSNSTLSRWGYSYDLMSVLYGRADLQATFSGPTTSLSGYESLVNWAGGVVTNSFVDSDAPKLSPFGYYYALMFVYDDRSDLQTAFPNAFSNNASYQALLGWAKGVVLGDFTDSSLGLLEQYAADYEELG